MSMSAKLKSKLMSGGIWAFIGRFSTAFMTLAVNMILARMLSAEDVGVYFLAWNIALFGAYIGTLGFEQTALRYVADSLGRNERANVTYIITFAIAAAVCGAVLVGILYFFSSDWIAKTIFQSSGLAAISTLVIFWIGANSFQILLGEAFRGFHDIRFASIFGGVLSTALYIIALLGGYYFQWFPFTLHWTIGIWVSSIVASNFMGMILLVKQVRSLRQRRWSKRTLHGREVLATALPLMVVSVSLYILNQCDLWIIGAVGDDEAVAIYGAAAKLTMIAVMPLYVVNAVVSPLIAEQFAQGEMKNLEGTLRFVGTLAVIPSLGLVVLFIFFGGPVLSLVFGSALYSSGASILILLALKQLLIVWNGATSTILAMSGKQKQLMRITVWTGCLSIGLSLLLGYYAGGVGVAFGFLLSNGIAQIWIWLTAYKAFAIRADVDVLGTFQRLKVIGQKEHVRTKARVLRDEHDTV